jgi:peptide/nickel transport system substrate-binding protein
VIIGAGALAGALALPRFAIGQADSRPAITVAVQKIATSNTLEPMREQSNVGQRSFYPIMETLIDVDWLGDLSLKPGLAESWRRIDDSTPELTPRDNVRFHNGEVMTAEDVAFSFGPDRMWSGTEAGRSGLFVNMTAGAATKTPPPEAPAIAKAAYPGFDRIEIVDRRTVRFVNKTPDVTLEGRLIRNTGSILSRRGFEQVSSWPEWARKPVATGPYRVAQSRPDQDMLLEAHDECWGGKPPPKSIRFVEVPEVASRADGLLASDFDFAFDLPPDRIERIEASPRHHVVGRPIRNMRITAFDKYHPVLKDARVRRAMSHAVDRQAILDSLWLGRTRIPKGLQWPFFGKMHLDDWNVPAFDPALAKSLMAEAGYRGEEIPYQLLNNYYTNQTPTAQALVEGWRSVGLNVRVEMKENWSQILAREPGRGICDNSNSAWFNDPVASVSVFSPGGQQWEANQWRNEDAAAALKRLQDSTDTAVRRDAFRRMLTIIEREDPPTSCCTRTAPSPASARPTAGSRPNPSSWISAGRTGTNVESPKRAARHTCFTQGLKGWGGTHSRQGAT